jgi:hypothetical protein
MAINPLSGGPIGMHLATRLDGYSPRMDIYSHVLPDMQDAAVSAVENALS